MFKVFRISTNTNSFGLWGFWLYNTTTLEVYSAATSHKPKFGKEFKDVYNVGFELVNYEFTVAASDRSKFIAEATDNIATQLAAQQKASLL
jgi:hypothetical protein